MNGAGEGKASTTSRVTVLSTGQNGSASCSLYEHVKSRFLTVHKPNSSRVHHSVRLV